MKTVEVSKSALESLQKMVEQLQGERDELLKVVCKIRNYIPAGAIDVERYRNGLALDKCLLTYDADKIIAKCTTKPEVLE